MKRTSLSILSLFLLSACTASDSSANFTPTSDASEVPASVQKKIEQISSIFENSTSVFQYAYVEDIGDGVGITAGRAGFNSEELVDLIQNYSDQKASNPLAKYLPCLKSLSNFDNYACLFPSVSASMLKSDQFKEESLKQKDFGKDFILAAKDPDFRALQDQAIAQNITRPTEAWAKKLNIKTAIGKLILFDAIFQHGFSETQGFEKILSRTPGRDELVKEKDWLSAFMWIRRDMQLHPYHEDGVRRYLKAPFECYERSDALIELLESGNDDLSGPITIHYFGETFHL